MTRPLVTRTLVVWCADWPVVAAGCPRHLPVAVVAGNEVVACSPAARAEGVEWGLRRRQAESRCPGLTLVDHDPARDARAFDPVVAAVESFTPRVEIGPPGTCAFATRGPSRYFGGDHALAARVVARVDEVLAGGAVSCRVGIADGRFAAERAARVGTVVPPGGSAAFLTSFPVSTLERPELADLLGRLGVRTLGELAALPAPAVLARFGPEGAVAHRRARGLDDQPLAARTPPPDLAVVTELDPPVERVETVAFAAKSLADRLHHLLAERGLAATCLSIAVETEHGERQSRSWRMDTGGAAAIAQRMRWQLEGWLGAGRETPTGGITRLQLRPEEVGPDRGRQLDLSGVTRDGDERAARGLARIQAMLGPEAVVTGVVGGGRSPAEQVRLVPWGDPRHPVGPGSAPVRPARRPASDGPGAPWPGGVPPPAPAIVPPEPLPAEVVDAAGVPVAVTGRGRATAEPARLRTGGGGWVEIGAWAGPWPVDERWWDPKAHRRRARWQVVTTEGSAYLLALEGGRWWVEAAYD